MAALVTACGSDTRESAIVSSVEVPSPAGSGSGEPSFAWTGDAVYLSWLEEVSDGRHALRLARLGADGFDQPREIARSDRFFVNWADFPSAAAASDGTLWAHWLQRGSEGGYDYGVRVVRSDDGGASWSAAWQPHEDDSPTEHGFVSLLPAGGRLGLAWLDGREHAPGADGSPPTQEMTLRFRWASAGGAVAGAMAATAGGSRDGDADPFAAQPGPELLVDGRVCDCCQTDAVLTSAGPALVYRDRSPAEIRDIYVTRLVDGAWTEGVPVHEDGWEIAGCPVNGPAAAAAGDQMAVAWFAAPGDVPRVRVAFSSDGGASFGAPVVVDDGDPMGRVDILMLDGGDVLISWLERTGGDGAAIRLRRVGADGTVGASSTIVSSSAERASGFPRLALAPDGTVLVAWTDIAGGASQVRISRVTLGAGTS
jgi:hypothetical protein